MHILIPYELREGLTISPLLQPQFRQALTEVEVAMIQEGWLDREDLTEGIGRPGK
jgi:hypothetical protein